MLEKGLLDDLSFEDLVSAYEDEDGTKKRESTKNGTKEEIYIIREHRCRFNNFNPCDDQCQYYLVCTGGSMKIPLSEAAEDKNEINSRINEYCDWLRKKHFHERVIKLYKIYAMEDESVNTAKDHNELLDYLRDCEKKYTGQRKNFYKYYLKYLRLINGI